MAFEKITLNLIPTGETPTIHAAQFDKERAFQIELKEGEDDFSPTGYDIELQVRKVDNNIVTAVPSQVSSNIVTFLTTEQMTACSGTNLAELQISKNNMSIATLHFYLVVQRDVLAGGLSSQSEIYDLEEQIAAIVPEVIGDDYYTAEEVDEKIAEIPTFDPTNYYTKSQLYTKTETNGLLSAKANTSALSTVAFSGSYTDLTNKPTIPAAQVQSNWSQSDNTKVDYIKNKPTIPTDAEQLPITSGSSTNTKSYIDSGLSGKADTSELYDILPTEQGSGAIAHFTDGADNIPVKSLVSQIVAVQDLHGYDHPWVGGAGKNLFDEDSVEVGTAWNGESNVNRARIVVPCKPSTTYTLSMHGTNGLDLIVYGYYATTPTLVGNVLFPQTFTTNSVSAYIVIGFNKSNITIGDVEALKVQLEEGSIPTSYEPFENICPITGFDSGVITVTDNDQVTNTYTFAFGQTVYGGHFDNKGNLVVTHSFIASYNGETINEPWISSMDNYVPNTLPSIGAQVVYPLTNPITLSITSQVIPTLLGENNIYADTGDVDVTIRADIGLYIDKKISSLAQA